MPYKNEEEQRTAIREAVKRLRARRKAEAEATGKKFEDTIPLTPENLNYEMKPETDKPLSFEGFQALNPKATQKEWIQYKIKWSYDNKWKEEQEKANRLKAMNEREKYGTRNHDCIIWRRMREKGQRSDSYVNHIANCPDCNGWAKRNENSLDLNANGKKAEGFEELRGYEEAFCLRESFPEDYAYSPRGAFLMNSVCPNCGTPLTARGNCPICNPQPDD